MSTSNPFCPACQAVLPKVAAGAEYVSCANCGQKIRLRAKTDAAAQKSAAGSGPGKSVRKFVVLGGDKKDSRRNKDIDKIFSVDEVFDEDAPIEAIAAMVDDDDGDDGRQMNASDDGDAENYVFWESPPVGGPAVGDLGVPTASLEDTRSLWADDLDPAAGIDEPVRHGMDFSADAGDIVGRIKARPRVVAAADDPAVKSAEVIAGPELFHDGSGTVRRARQTSLNRNVSLKLPPAKGSANEAAKGRAIAAVRRHFVAEAVVAAHLEHPRIMPVHDLGLTGDGSPFYVMGDFRGRRWKDILDRQSEREKIEILCQVCEAVAFAHENGILHRDIRPANVLVDRSGQARLFGWGLAVAFNDRAAAVAERLVDANARAGQPAYMAPEMARGDFARIGPASDVYLLGGCLYEALTGLAPHAGIDAVARLHNAMNGKIQAANHSGDLIELARRALRPRPNERFANAREFLMALSPYRRHREALALIAAGNRRLAGEPGDDQWTRALHGFEEAARLWPRGGPAQRGIARARLACARHAVQRGKFEDAASFLAPLGRPALARELEAAPAEERAFLRGRNRLWEGVVQEAEKMNASIVPARRRRDGRRLLARAGVGVAAAALLLVTVFSLLGYWRVASNEANVRAAQGKAEKSAAEAEEQRARADEARRLAAEAQARADEARKNVEVALKEAEEGKRNAEKALLDARLSQREAAVATARAEQAEEERRRIVADVREAEKWLPGVAGGGGDGQGTLLAQSLEHVESVLASPGDLDAWGRLVSALAFNANTPEEAARAARALRTLSIRADADGQTESARVARLLSQRYARHSGAFFDAAAPVAGGAAGTGAPDGEGVLAADTARVHHLDFSKRQRQLSVAGVANRRGKTAETHDARRAELDTPVAPAAGTDGAIYFSDRGNFRVCRIGPDGGLETFAGNGENKINRDGRPAWDAGIGAVDALAVNASGDLFLATRNPPTVRRVEGGGGHRIGTILGDADRPAATDAPFLFPGDGDNKNGSAVDADGGETFRVRIPDVSVLRIGEPRGLAVLDDENIAVLLVAAGHAVDKKDAVDKSAPKAAANGGGDGDFTADHDFEPPPPPPAACVLRVNVVTGEGEAWGLRGRAPGPLAVDHAGRLWMAGELLCLFDGIRFNEGFQVRRAATFEMEGRGEIMGLACAPDGSFFYLQGGERITAIRRISPESLRLAMLAEGRAATQRRAVVAESAVIQPGERRDSPESGASNFAAPPPGALGELDFAGNLLCIAGERLVFADPTSHRVYAFTFEPLTPEAREEGESNKRAAQKLRQSLAAVNPNYDQSGYFDFQGGKLRMAFLPAAGLVDITPLGGHHESLIALDVSANALTGLDGLEDAPLAMLDCSNNRLSDLSPLAGRPLRALIMDGNRVRNLDMLKGMRSLQRLRFRDNAVASLDFLTGSRVMELSFFRNQIDDFTALGKITRPTIRVLGAADDQVREVKTKNARLLRLLAYESRQRKR